MLFPGGFFYLILRPRLQLILGVWQWGSTMLRHLATNGWRKWTELPRLTREFRSGHWYTAGEFYDLVLNNLVVLGSWWLMGRWLGYGLFWSCYATVMTFSAAIFICIFFVQHNYPGSYAHGTDGWSYFKGAIDGSSNLLLPPILNWFSADIAFHSIHHLCERIPNYRLRQCHERNAHLLKGAKRLRLADIPGCLRFILWDSKDLRLISLAEAAG
jgi:omega-6 fatty acid desaturase (delta-12 desaturase)